jgi:hypothetical protein
MDAEMDRWWGKDEDSYLDEDGKPISKEDYYKQFENQDKSPVEPEYPEQPQFVGDPTQFKPMPFDPNNPMMYMGSGSPFYHLRGAGAEDDELARRMAEFLAPHISHGIGQVADGIQDFLKSPEQREQEKRDKEALEEAERKKKEREEGSWSSYLSPFFHLRGGEMGDDGGMTLEEWNCREGIGNCLQKDGTPIDRFYGYGKLDEMTVRQLIDYGKSLGIKGLDGKTKDVIITKIEAGPKETKKVAKTMVPPSVDGGIPKLPEGLSETEYKELLVEVYNMYIAESLVHLQSKAKELKITRIPHKTKEALAREVAKKHVDAEIDEILNPPITDPEDPEYRMVYTASEMRAEREHQAKQAKAERARLKAQRRAREAPKKKASQALHYMLDRMSGKGNPVLPPQDALESKKDNPVVEEIIEEPMDDGDIRSYFPNAKIIRYSSLAKMSDIEQLLPRDKTYAFLLYEDSPGSGHWVVVLRYGTTIEFFCSYGSKIDGPLRWYNPKDNVMLGQNKPYLSLLLKKADKKFKAIHNAVPFQSSKHGVATCGAWDVMRVNQLVNHNQDLHEFQSYMEDVKKETGLTYDEIVANYVNKR